MNYSELMMTQLKWYLKKFQENAVVLVLQIQKIMFGGGKDMFFFFFFSFYVIVKTSKVLGKYIKMNANQLGGFQAIHVVSIL